MYDEEVRDYGFDEPDTTYLFSTTNDEKVELRKNRHWFDVEGEMDYDISYSLLVNGKVFMSFPKEVSRCSVVDFAHTHFEVDEECTNELQSMYAEMEAERRMGA